MGDVIERTETLAAEPAHALGGLLGVPVPDLAGGAGLPLLWHWCYLLDRPAQADLGPDGHPVRGVLPAPPAPGLRRMWAGGRVRASGVLRCGEPATRLTRVLSMTDKVGRTGPMTFVVVGHQIVQRDQVVVDEEQDIVYRAPADAAGGVGGRLAAAPSSRRATASGRSRSRPPCSSGSRRSPITRIAFTTTVTSPATSRGTRGC